MKAEAGRLNKRPFIPQKMGFHNAVPTATKGSVLLIDNPSLFKEAVNHPSHYNKGGLEAVDVIEKFGLDFNLGNVVKYVLRSGFKGRRIEDLEKAKWYLKREIETLKKG